jgi:hypothetical protein
MKNFLPDAQPDPESQGIHRWIFLPISILSTPLIKERGG